jgi:hypothetical protein
MQFCASGYPEKRLEAEQGTVAGWRWHGTAALSEFLPFSRVRVVWGSERREVVPGEKEKTNGKGGGLEPRIEHSGTPGEIELLTHTEDPPVRNEIA